MTFSNSEFSDWSIIVTDANEDDHGQWECACHETSPFTSIRHNKTVVTVLYQKGNLPVVFA